MKRNHWIGVTALFLVILWGLEDPAGIGHALTGLFQGIDGVIAQIKNVKA